MRPTHPAKVVNGLVQSKRLVELRARAHEILRGLEHQAKTAGGLGFGCDVALLPRERARGLERRPRCLGLSVIEQREGLFQERLLPTWRGAGLSVLREGGQPDRGN